MAFRPQGFSARQARRSGTTEVLEELCELLARIAPDGQFLWNNQQVVHLFVNGQREPWAAITPSVPARSTWC